MSNFQQRSQPKTLVLFDVDGTLTLARKNVEPEMLNLLAQLREKVVIGFVGGSNLTKQIEQLGNNVLENFDFCFAENGLTAYKNGTQFYKGSFIGHLGEDRYKKLANFILKYIADLDIPMKRGTFIEFRNGMINVSPIGRNCSYEERLEFEKFDLKNNIRKDFISKLKEEFSEYNLTYSIGGQISFDVFPVGWNKTFSLSLLKDEGFEQIHFFGDKTFEGGNDYEIYTDSRVTGHSVKNPDDTMKIVNELFF